MNESRVVVPFFRTPFNYDSRVVSDDTGLSCPEESLAVQDAAEECDINTIVKRFGITGELPQGVRVPSYGDFTGVSDYRSALDLVMASDDAFMRFPADVRARFNHDPGEMLAFVEDASNYDEAVRLGFITSPKVSEPAVPASANTEVNGV